jgi:tripeptide aminopeptidase
MTRPTNPPAASAFARIGQIASLRAVHVALGWLHLHEQQTLRWQMECVAIPAPSFAEAERAAWLRERFCDLGLQAVEIDGAGNVLGWLPSSPGAPGDKTRDDASDELESSEDTTPVIVLSAHIDTVFPAGTPIEPVLKGTRLHAPGACDNGAGIAALLAIAASLQHAAIRTACRIVFLANTCEEGEGDLRGVRHIYANRQNTWQGRIAAHLVLDGAGQSVAVTRALGSRRFEAVIEGSGGHSWTDAARPNPLVALSDAIVRMRERQAAREASPRITARSTWNVGSIEGGSSINSIPSSAVGRFDLRSTESDDLLRLEVDLHRAVEDAVLAANAGAPGEHLLRSTVRLIGDRPASALPDDARALALLRAVDRHLGLRTELRTASTDANIPLSLGVEALSLGAGGEGSGTHTLTEWFDAKGRDLALRRILLLLLALADCRTVES